MTFVYGARNLEAPQRLNGAGWRWWLSEKVSFQRERV